MAMIRNSDYEEMAQVFQGLLAGIVDSREYRINYSFNCDSSNVVCLLECTVCGV